jgi:Protein of unknown function (DUF3631)
MPLTTAHPGNPLEQVVAVFARYVDAKPHYLIGVALWALHTHIYNQYSKSPRLAILSPVANCGKSTVLDVLSAMVWNSKRITEPSVASTFRLANGHTLLMDEVDNMSIIRSMRAILNDGHSVGGAVTRTGKDGEVICYPIYGPVALGGIGRLPATLMSRSLVMRLHRSTKAMERFRTREQYFAPELSRWAAQANLNPDPQMPVQLAGRDADKWRPLIAIADSFDRGAIARDVALIFLNENDTSDIKESVLRDTERVFIKLEEQIITAQMLYETLREDNEGEYEVDYVEQKITKRALGNILADFQIRSIVHRYRGGAPAKCWFREDFEEMWERYAQV